MPEEVKKPAARVRREHFFALVLLGLLYALLTVPPLQQRVAPSAGPEASRLVRVVLPPLPQVFQDLSPYGPGFDAELLRTFSRSCGYELAVTQAGSLQQAWDMLARGEADLLVGSGYEPPAGLRGAFAIGPAYRTHRPVVIRGERAGRLYIKGSVGKRWKRLRSRPFLMKANAPLEARLLPEAPWLGKSMITRVSPRYGLQIILDSLAGGQAAYALVDSGRLRLWHPFFPELRTERTLSQPIAYRWFWRTTRRDLAVTLNYFWQAAGTKAKLRELNERYAGFLPKKVSRVGVEHFLETLATALPEYRSKILHETRRCGLDPLLFVAMIYQESQFDPKARSRTGAKGLLQFTSAAAAYFDLKDPLDGAESIRAGADYLKLLWDSLDGLGLSHWDRCWFALAAYNQGKGHVFDALELAYKQGLKGTTWADLKRTLPKLQQREYADYARYGRCRGREAVRFVDSIRYYYYILRGLIFLARPEAQHLVPLVGGRLLAVGAGF